MEQCTDSHALRYYLLYALVEYLMGRRARRTKGPGSVVEALVVCGYIGVGLLKKLRRRRKR